MTNQLALSPSIIATALIRCMDNGLRAEEIAAQVLAIPGTEGLIKSANVDGNDDDRNNPLHPVQYRRDARLRGGG